MRNASAGITEKFGKRIALLTAVSVLLLSAYLSLWPVSIDPFTWHAPRAPGYTGVDATNTKLVGLHHFALNGNVGPEHVVLGPDSKLYAGVASDDILRERTEPGQRYYPTSAENILFVSESGRSGCGKLPSWPHSST